MKFFDYLNEVTVSDKDADILNSITIGELQSKYSGKPELEALIELLIKDKYKNPNKSARKDISPKELYLLIPKIKSL